MACALTLGGIERQVYTLVCEFARRITVEMLENADAQIRSKRNRGEFHNMGVHQRTVKTIYGEVEYKRTLYKDKQGKLRYLLDEELQIEGSGSYSPNMTDLVIDLSKKMSFRNVAVAVSQATGQTISHGAVWNIVQNVGRKLNDDENKKTRLMKSGYLQGKIKTPVLFEEMDGVWLALQGDDRPKCGKKEMKVSIAYTGVVRKNGERRLKDKVCAAGFHTSKAFINRREAGLCAKYDMDNVKTRIINADGAGWIKNMNDSRVVYQLDRFHIEQEITRRIRNKHIQQNIKNLIHANDVDGALDYIDTYAISVEGRNDGRDAKDARTLYNYINNNKDGVIPWQERDLGKLSVPAPPKSVMYSHLGAMENNNCTIITQRMKGNRRSWSIDGANNMAKILTAHENHTLKPFLQNLTDSEILSDYIDVQTKAELYGAHTVPKTVGKGSAVHTTSPLLRNWQQSPEIKAILRLFDGKACI